MVFWGRVVGGCIYPTTPYEAINKGKVIWTSGTGRGLEFDDVWMLFNGSILFTRMSYIAEIPGQSEH